MTAPATRNPRERVEIIDGPLRDWTGAGRLVALRDGRRWLRDLAADDPHNARLEMYGQMVDGLVTLWNALVPFFDLGEIEGVGEGESRRVVNKHGDAPPAVVDFVRHLRNRFHLILEDAANYPSWGIRLTAPKRAHVIVPPPHPPREAGWDLVEVLSEFREHFDVLPLALGSLPLALAARIGAANAILDAQVPDLFDLWWDLDLLEAFAYDAGGEDREYCLTRLARLRTRLGLDVPPNAGAEVQ